MIKRAGFVALIGRPNVGKSTLLNEFAGMELAITSAKPQTTRHLIRAIVDYQDAQIVFIDSPGLHESEHHLDRYMAKAASVAIEQADVILLLIDARFKPFVDVLEKRVMRRAEQSGKPLILLLNKVDLAAKDRLLPLIQAYHEAYPFKAIIPISAKEKDGLEAVLEEITKVLPEQAAIFNDGEFTDQSERILAAEFIRAELLWHLREEIPHGTAVQIERFDELDDEQGERRRVQIEAVIYCDRPGHKGIILGKKGQQIKAIGTAARLKIAEMCDCPVDLQLFVKVKENWRNQLNTLEGLGYDSARLEE